MYEYSRDVFYYETDKMGVVHHSNYIRWLEEARTAFFDAADLAYTVTESLGVMSPVTDIDLKFKHPARFGDKFTVKLRMTKYTGVRFRIVYAVVNQDGESLLEGESGHCFIGEDYKPVSMSRAIPHRHQLLKELLKSYADEENPVSN